MDTSKIKNQYTDQFRQRIWEELPRSHSSNLVVNKLHELLFELIEAAGDCLYLTLKQLGELK